MAADDTLITSPIPGILLRVEGDDAAVRHLRSEYGDDRGSETTPSWSAELLVRFVDRLPSGRPTDVHKTVRWSAALEHPDDRHFILSIALRGRPRWFGLSLVQGYLVEPALSLVAVGAGAVLLSAAAVVRDGSVLLMVGRSGSGKTTLALRALAAGMGFLGDDQVTVGADGMCRRFPRRLRLYDDARGTAPAAIEGLPAAVRRRLSLRRLVRVGTRGFAAPSLAVAAGEVRGARLVTSAPLQEVVLLERGKRTSRVERHEADVSEAVDECLEVAEAQRKRLRWMLGDAWAAGFAEVEARERALLAQAFGSVAINRLVAPDTGAVAAIAAVAQELGLP